MLGAARTRARASHGGAHGPENRREKVPKRAVAEEERREGRSVGGDDEGGREGEAGEEASKRGPLRRRRLP